MAAVSEQRVQPGSLLGGRYRVDVLLGRGGMASVWSGLDQQMGRQVAIKVLHLNAPTGSTAWARFEREARSTAAINDPHIVTVHDTGLDDDTAYLVLELLPGPTLSQHLAEHGPMPVPRVLDITAQVCEALTAAHALGIVHRDIKPSNVMFAGHDRVKVLDLGITQLIGDTTSADATLTSPGEALGTPAFMAPEQIEGKRVDARTDLYALGCLITAMLAGKPPFHDASPMSVIASHAHHTPPDVRLARPDTPAGLADLVAALLAKDPRQRPASADEVLDTVHRLSADTEAPGSTSKSPRRAIAITAAALILIGAGAGIYTAAGAPGFPQTGPSTEQAAATPSPSKTATPGDVSTVSLASTTLTGALAYTGPLTQSCENPLGFTVSYPQNWYRYVPSPSEEQIEAKCRWFGSAPMAEYSHQADAPSAPVSVWVSQRWGFDEASTHTTPGFVETSRQQETVNGRRVLRIEATLNDNGGDTYLPNGTRMVNWLVEMPPSVTGDQVFGGWALPNGVVVGGVADDAQIDSMDVAANAAVLDAMMRSVVFTQPFTKASTPPTASSAPPDSSSVEALSDPCLRVRFGPNTAEKQIGCVPKGALVDVECAVEGERVVGLEGYESTIWGRIAYEGKVGYVSGAWVNPSLSSAAPC